LTFFLSCQNTLGIRGLFLLLAMVIPPLEQLKIRLVQLGEEKDPLFQGCLCLRGRTSVAQAAYLIKRAVMHIGTDTFTTHIASHFDKKIVSLYSNSPIQNCGPFWSKKTNTILLEADRRGDKHSFATEEKPKTIDRIEPERIAYSLFKLLGIETKIKHKTVYMGPKWNLEFLEVVPSAVAKFSQKGRPQTQSSILAPCRLSYALFWFLSLAT
jgi:hypothetical protein